MDKPPNYEYWHIHKGRIQTSLPFENKAEAVEFYTLQSRDMGPNDATRILLFRRGRLIHDTWQPSLGKPKSKRATRPDCNAEVETKGHMACQYPQDWEGCGATKQKDWRAIMFETSYSRSIPEVMMRRVYQRLSAISRRHTLDELSK